MVEKQANFVKVSGRDFTVNGEKILLRGFGLGSWMNLEHFMIGLPGTDSMIKKAFREIYGEANAKQFFHRFLLEFVDDQDFQFLKRIGVNSIRIPFHYKYFIDDQNPYEYKKEGFVYLDHIINLCEKYEIYAILDMHSVPGGQNPDWHCDTTSGLPLFWEYRALRDTVISLWGHIADYYKNQPWIAAYDIVNEPAMVTDAKAFNEFYEQVIAEIRKYDPHHIIFIEGNDFTTDFSMLDPVDDPQVAYEFHFYPFVKEPLVLSREMSRERRMEIFTEAFTELVSIREKYNRPVWCGELGLVFEQQDIDFQITIIEDMLNLCEAHEVSWSLWTYKDAGVMGIVYPKMETPWRQLTEEIKAVWNQHKEQEIGEALVDYMANQYFQPIAPEDRYPLQFRMRTIMQVICVEQNLKPYLQKRSFDEIMELPSSFHWDNCQHWQELEQLIRRYTKV